MPELARPGFAPVCTDATVDYEHDSRGRVAEQPILREAHFPSSGLAAVNIMASGRADSGSRSTSGWRKIAQIGTRPAPPMPLALL